MQIKRARLNLSPTMTKYYLSFFMYGEDQAQTRKELMERIGCTDRELRLIVAAIRRYSEGEAVLVASNTGYYLTENPVHIKRWIRRSRAHLKSFEQELVHAEAVLKRQSGGRSDGG